MNLLQRLARHVISVAFRMGIGSVACFYNRSSLERRAACLKRYPPGTLGKDISDCLLQHGLRELPYYQDHDLKHVLLGFAMTPVDEIRLQAFMIGNGNYSFAAFALFGLGALLLPDEWPAFYRDYLHGKAALPIRSWTVRTHGRLQTAALRELIFRMAPSSRKMPRSPNRRAFSDMLSTA